MKEKSEFEKRAAEKQVSLLTEALTSTVDAKGHWLNASGKLYPKLYPKGFSVSPFNALILALDSDAKGCKSNLFTQFSEAKARGESVREHEKGVPFLYYIGTGTSTATIPTMSSPRRHTQNCRNRISSSTRE